MAKGSREPLDPARAPVDRRNLRSQRSRERILAALEQVLADPDLELTPAQICARAGVSVSTLFRHFGDLEGIDRAMRDRVHARVAPHLAPRPFEGSLRGRVHELVERLSTAFEIVAPFYRVGVRQPHTPSSTRSLPFEIGNATREQVRAALERELAGAPETEVLVCTVLSFEAWNHLRTARALAADRIPPLLERGVMALLRDARRNRGPRRRSTA